ncbi:hypothetical protein DSM3645_15460 [Blastopirellula marina DSM 3645]|uniref:Uncharacterized protein n=1 Tax=Blastopirellula marina DSM 3645 TaxID=314230 RepID=A3ZZ83_9BACT|nr:hypothetical protein DSM3645_15460 [Blastopirellula marina DSM 3645]
MFSQTAKTAYFPKAYLAIQFH